MDDSWPKKVVIQGTMTHSDGHYSIQWVECTFYENGSTSFKLVKDSEW